MTVGARTAPVLPVNPMLLHRIIRHGLVRLELPGPGRRRRYPPEELRALRAVAAGLTGGHNSGPEKWTPARLRFLADVADAARSNPPGEVVEIVTPCPFVRHVLIVPEP